MALGSTQRDNSIECRVSFPEGEGGGGGGGDRADNIATSMCRLSENPVSLNLLKASGLI
jgi:hypothetical protein